jgi:dTDP-4-dehydrorhamnose reductase
MKILVFGKTGQVATELRRHAGVVALGRDQADLMDPAACAAVVREADADVVINAAAWTAVDKAEAEEAAATVVNGAAPAAMAQAAAERGIPFLHISTDYVFSGTGTAPWQVDDPVAPPNAYGRSKLVGEAGVRAAGGTAAILRTSWVFSAHGANFVRTMLRLSESRDALNVVEDQIGGPTPAADIAAALLVMARAMRAGQPGGTYHFGGMPWVSWADFAREIFALSGRKVAVTGIPSSAYPTPAVRPLNSRMDCGALARGFGIAAPDWREGLSKVLKELGV